MKPRRATLALLTLLGAFCACLIACGDRDAAPASSDESRIVSLAPTLTNMLADLGVVDRVVGVAQFDTLAPPGTPVVGTYVDVDVERLLSVRPTLVLTMAGKEGVPPRLRDLAEAGRFRLHTWDNPDPFRLEDALRILIELGDVIDRADEAAALRDDLLAELDRVREAVADRPAPRVLLVISTAPVMAIGPGTAHDQMLALAGGTNAAADAVVTAPTFDREALIAMQPEVILLLSPDTPPLTDGDERLRAFRGLPVPAVEHGRIILLNDPLVLLTGTSMVQTVRQMAEAIHGDLPAIEADDEP